MLDHRAGRLEPRLGLMPTATWPLRRRRRVAVGTRSARAARHLDTHRHLDTEEVTFTAGPAQAPCSV
eukprot:2790492-Prymnesium_polylepis.1